MRATFLSVGSSSISASIGIPFLVNVKEGIIVCPIAKFYFSAGTIIL